MNYPRSSFFIALLILILTSFLVSFFLTKKVDITPVSLEIEADMLQNDSSHQEIKSAGIKKSSQVVKNHDLLNADSNSREKNSAPTYHPLPEIPDDLRQEAFSSYATARFYINGNGLVENVELIKPCNNPKLNHLLVKSLRNWRFSAREKNWSQDINVNFEVK